MVSVKVITRKTPLGFETLLLVNGAIGRAEEMLCLETANSQEAEPSTIDLELTEHDRSVLRRMTHLASAEFAPFDVQR